MMALWKQGMAGLVCEVLGVMNIRMERVCDGISVVHVVCYNGQWFQQLEMCMYSSRKL